MHEVMICGAAKKHTATLSDAMDRLLTDANLRLFCRRRKILYYLTKVN